MQYEAVIIGAGIMGLCTAYYLNQGGMKRILVVDREPYFGGYNTPPTPIGTKSISGPISSGESPIQSEYGVITSPFSTILCAR